MTVTLLHNTPLWGCSTAIRKCWASEDKSDSYYNVDDYYKPKIYTLHDGESYCPSQIVVGEKDKELIHRVGNKNKHSSTLEHLNYTFDIDGISRALLQELARHRIASYSVKSTRYTLKELKDEKSFDYVIVPEHWDRAAKFIVLTGEDYTDVASIRALESLREVLVMGVSNDKAKYCLPEAYKTSLVWTINARSLQNFLALRTSKAALWEIRDLAYAIYDQIPTEHQYLFTDSLAKNKKPEPSCTTCKWVKLGGEYEHDECHNTSLSAHLDQGTLVADDFCCNRYEEE